VLAGEAARLEETRLAVVEERIGCDLALGRHAEVVGELATLVAQFPLRERLVALLMTALYRCGRRGEALAVYDAARRVLAEELGLDPGPELAGLQVQVLADDPALTAVMEVLTAFVREQSLISLRTSRPDGSEPDRSPRSDVQAALTVVGRLTVLEHGNAKRHVPPIDLIGTKLAAVDLTGVDLHEVTLTGADLTDATLTRADLTHAHLNDAYLSGANLTDADLTGAILAMILGPNPDPLSENLQVIPANLTRADLTGANLTGADLTDANLTGAQLGGVDLTDAVWPTDMAAPEGWQRRTDWGSRLERSDTNPGEATAN
jgi:hypothetical protein